MSDTLLNIFNRMEAYHLGAANEAAKAKKLLAGEGKPSSRKQRGRELGAKAIAKRMSKIPKQKTQKSQPHETPFRKRAMDDTGSVTIKT